MSNFTKMQEKITEKIDDDKITLKELAVKVQILNDTLNELLDLIKTRNF